TVADAAALIFSGVLYEKLAERVPLEAAVTEARLAVYQADSRAIDWFCPALYLRGADERLAKEEEAERLAQERDVRSVSYKGNSVKTNEWIVAAEIDDGSSLAPSDDRASDNRVSVETQKADVGKKFVIAASIKGKSD